MWRFTVMKLFTLIFGCVSRGGFEWCRAPFTAARAGTDGRFWAHVGTWRPPCSRAAVRSRRPMTQRQLTSHPTRRNGPYILYSIRYITERPRHNRRTAAAAAPQPPNGSSSRATTASQRQRGPPRTPHSGTAAGHVSDNMSPRTNGGDDKWRRYV